MARKVWKRFASKTPGLSGLPPAQGGGELQRGRGAACAGAACRTVRVPTAILVRVLTQGRAQGEARERRKRKREEEVERVTDYLMIVDVRRQVEMGVTPQFRPRSGELHMY